MLGLNETLFLCVTCLLSGTGCYLGNTNSLTNTILMLCFECSFLKITRPLKKGLGKFVVFEKSAMVLKVKMK